jgi:hypothetical protein
MPLLLAGLAACGGDADDDRDIFDRLSDLPGVTVAEWMPPDDFDPPAGVRYFDLWFELPIDHDDPAQGTFLDYAALQHVDEDAPLVLYSSGYGAGRTRTPSEPAAILDANQLSIEYRFYEGSRPESIPWDRLRVAQATADQHEMVTALASIYGGPRIATGGSKGGEHAMQFAHDYPGDVDGVVAYVAPVITDLPDLRYEGNLDVIGLPDCRESLRAIARELLVRRDAMESRAELEASFAIAGVDHAVETAVVELEFAFWMTRGELDCGAVPPTTADDDALYEFLADTSWPGAYGDEDLRTYGAQYLYQDQVELGYPVWEHTYLDDLLVYVYEDWSAYLPDAPLFYANDKPVELDAWLTTDAPRVMLILGEWDPWSPGAPASLGGEDSARYVVPHGSHWSSRIDTLPAAERDEAITTLLRWAD